MILKIQAFSKSDIKITEADFRLQLNGFCTCIVILILQNYILCKKRCLKLKLAAQCCNDN